VKGLFTLLRRRGYLVGEEATVVTAHPLSAVSDHYDRDAQLKRTTEWTAREPDNSA